jgi:hypothetical protein
MLGGELSFDLADCPILDLTHLFNGQARFAINDTRSPGNHPTYLGAPKVDSCSNAHVSDKRFPVKLTSYPEMDCRGQVSNLPLQGFLYVTRKSNRFIRR